MNLNWNVSPKRNFQLRVNAPAPKYPPSKDDMTGIIPLEFRNVNDGLPLSCLFAFFQLNYNKRGNTVRMAVFKIIFVTALLIPYLGWGIYTLRLRYRFHSELEGWVEWITLVAVLITNFSFLNIMKTDMGHNPGFFAFTLLAMLTAFAALYGPMLVSRISHSFVEFTHPEQMPEEISPDFAPAESLEDLGDWDGALQEYTVLARIFPKEPEPVLRMANTLIELNRWEEAASMMERGLNQLNDETRSLRLTYRLVTLCSERLNDIERSVHAIDTHISTYPDTEKLGALEKRKSNLLDSEKPKEVVFSTALEPLEEDPLEPPD